jgi:hypothetical protein
MTGPFAFSVTRFITAVDVSCPPIKVTLTDTPGFGDSSGVEVDIANSVGVIRAVSKCKSVRPVIILSQKSIGDRW